MISTLIRGSSIIDLNPSVAKSEYLVDTETNEIIYPYTRAENILDLESVKPPIGVEGSLGPVVVKSFYFGYKNFAVGANNYLYTLPIEEPGVYLISACIILGQYRTICRGDNLTFSFCIAGAGTKCSTRSQSALHGYLEDTLSGIFILNEPTNISFILYTPSDFLPGIQLSDDKYSRIEIRYIKLSAIDQIK